MLRLSSWAASPSCWCSCVIQSSAPYPRYDTISLPSTGPHDAIHMQWSHDYRYETSDMRRKVQGLTFTRGCDSLLEYYHDAEMTGAVHAMQMQI